MLMPIRRGDSDSQVLRMRGVDAAACVIKRYRGSRLLTWPLAIDLTVHINQWTDRRQ
jgi:hypothetical protein